MDRLMRNARWKYFYPRPPRGGRRCASSARRRIRFIISIHALREEGDRERCLPLALQGLAISIHALREEGDAAGLLGESSMTVISIHALREEGDVSDHRQS